MLKVAESLVWRLETIINYYYYYLLEIRHMKCSYFNYSIICMNYEVWRTTIYMKNCWYHDDVT